MDGVKPMIIFPIHPIPGPWEQPVDDWKEVTTIMMIMMIMVIMVIMMILVEIVLQFLGIRACKTE